MPRKLPTQSGTREKVPTGQSKAGKPSRKRKTAKKTTVKTAAKKKGKRKSPTPRGMNAGRRSENNPVEGSHAQPSPARIRMYRQGLGDCFLITFGQQGDEKHMLIDCGSLGSTTTGVKVGDALDDIKQQTGGKLELLLATHAHHDHVGGFGYKSFEQHQFQVGRVWMGWTEDPQDPLARELRGTSARLTEAIDKAFGMHRAGASLKEHLSGLEEFEGLELGVGPLGPGLTTEETLDRLRDLGQAETQYLSPGGPPIEPPGIPGFRFYVLGPPRDLDKLSEMGEHGSEHLYHLMQALNAHTEADSTLQEYLAPFDARFCFPMSHAETFFPEYSLPDQQYRRIDGRWLESIAYLALKRDKLKNNTSAVLAIERIIDGKVMLFPADAQEGNILSWHDESMKWQVSSEHNDMRTVTAADLLRRTVFYKVGHHASHNATGKAEGLELMNLSDELTAFIPVDRRVALNKGTKGWKMPAYHLYRRLLEVCDGLVVRSDRGWARPSPRGNKTESAFQDIATDDEWDRWVSRQKLCDHVDTDADHYIDFFLN